MKENPTDQTPKKDNYVGLGLALGLCFGSALGLVFSAAGGSPAFFPIGIGSGMSIGLAIGTGLERRSAGDSAGEPR